MREGFAQEDRFRGPERLERFEETLPPELRLVPLLVAYIVGATERHKKPKEPPKAPPPVAIKEVKETPVSHVQEIKVEPPKPKQQEKALWEKSIREKETFKKREIKEVYNLVYYDPEKEEKKIVQVEQPIFYDTLEQKTIDESEALRREEPALKHLADPLLPKDQQQIEGEVEKRLKEQKEKVGFGKDIQTEMLKELDDAVQATPSNIAEVEKRKDALLKELEQREKLLQEALALLQKDDFDAFEKLLEKFPPLLRARLEAVMKENKKILFQFLLVEVSYIKWLRQKIKNLSLKDIERIAKSLAAYSIIGALRKILSKSD